MFSIQAQPNPTQPNPTQVPYLLETQLSLKSLSLLHSRSAVSRPDPDPDPDPHGLTHLLSLPLKLSLRRPSSAHSDANFVVKPDFPLTPKAEFFRWSSFRFCSERGEAKF